MKDQTNEIVNMLKAAAKNAEKTIKTQKKKKALFGAAKIAHEKKAAIERKVKASQASMKSVAKRKANMTPEELAAWRKKQSEASVKSHKARLAAMTAEQLAAYKAQRNAKAKAWREARKPVTVKVLAPQQTAEVAEAI